MSEIWQGEQVKDMLAMQESINQRISENWRNNNNPWYRAVWQECAELMDHCNWKWWKEQKTDLEQLHLEIVDIWHFTLSEVLSEEPDLARAAEFILREIGGAEGGDNILLAVEKLAEETLVRRKASVRHFAELMGAAGLSPAALYKMYIGKNVLNLFRQDHGYQEGTYRKQWNGKEDNWYLAEILDSIHPEVGGDYRAAIYKRLEEFYAK